VRKLLIAIAPAGDCRECRRRRRARSASAGSHARRPTVTRSTSASGDTHVGTIIYNINFDLRADLAPIGLISVNPMLLVAKKTLPADDLKSLVAYMKAHPGDAKFVNQNRLGAGRRVSSCRNSPARRCCSCPTAARARP